MTAWCIHMRTLTRCSPQSFSHVQSHPEMSVLEYQAPEHANENYTNESTALM